MANRKDPKGRVLRKGEYFKPAASKNGTDRYEYRYKDSITQNSFSIYNSDLGELRKKEKEVERNNDDGISNAGAKQTVNDLYIRYMKLKKGAISPYTYDNYRRLYEFNVKNSYLAEKSISNVKRSDIRVLYHNMVIEKKYSVGTVMILQNLLYPMFELAIDDKDLRVNPCKSALKDLNAIKSEPRKSLTREQKDAFLSFTRNHPYYCIYYPLFVILFESGLRISEFLGMTKNEIVDVNGEKCFHVDHQIFYKNAQDGQGCTWHAGPPKGGRAGYRYIPVSKAAECALEELDNYMKGNHLYERQVETCGYNNFLFSTKNGRPYKSSCIGRALDKIVEGYNLYEGKKVKSKLYTPLFLPDFSPHICRHTFATFKAMSDMPPKMLQYLMGHSNISVTMNIYADIEMNDFIKTSKELDNQDPSVYEPRHPA